MKVGTVASLNGFQHVCGNSYSSGYIKSFTDRELYTQLTLSDCRVLRIQSRSGHMEKMGILPTALFAAAALILVWPREVAGYAFEHQCVHEPIQVGR